MYTNRHDYEKGNDLSQQQNIVFNRRLNDNSAVEYAFVAYCLTFSIEHVYRLIKGFPYVRSPCHVGSV